MTILYYNDTIFKSNVCALSSVVERKVDVFEAAGSIPAARTYTKNKEHFSAPYFYLMKC